ncbi:MAG TPA: hypothetical protein VGI42_00555 [Chthoniobacterales bacterium]
MYFVAALAAELIASCAMIDDSGAISIPANGMTIAALLIFG